MTPSQRRAYYREQINFDNQQLDEQETLGCVIQTLVSIGLVLTVIGLLWWGKIA